MSTTTEAPTSRPDEPDPTDGQLIAQYLAGNTDRLEILYLRYHDRLQAQLRALTRDRDRAEDLEQQVWYKVMLGLSGFDQGRDFCVWLRSVAHNEFCSAWRHDRHLPACGLTDAEEQSLAASPFDEPAVRHAGQLIRESVESAGRRLPSHLRWAVEEHVVEGRSIVEMARERGVPAGTVRCWVTRGRKRVRRDLAALGCSTSARPAY
jgi:RNA polymerase sigma-70 factor (ECF subfamily)